MRLLGFYTGAAPDHRGRFLREIQQWPDERLEAVHDFIQWLFPLWEPSPVNPEAPVLDAETVRAFEARQELRENLRASFLRMLRFYGLAMRGTMVERGENFAEASRNWLTPGNHNHLRITRILKSLMTLGLAEEARAFFECLAAIYAQEKGKITDTTFRFWREALAES